MSISKILACKKTESADKLDKVAEIVKACRVSYGNDGVEIKDVKVNTSHGNLPFSNLEDDSKVELLMNEALNIKATAIAAVEDNTGMVLNKKVEELIATNPLFANVTSETGFDVL